MGDPRAPKQPAWKRASGAAPQNKQPSQKDWQHQPPGGAKTPVTAWGLPKGARVGLAAAALLAVVGFGLWWVLFPKRDTKPHFVLLGAGYETNLAVPHNVAGIKGLRALQGFVQQDDARDGGDRVKTPELKAGGKDVERLFERGFFSRDKVPQEVVVFVAAHGVGVPVGESRLTPCLVPDDFDPGMPADNPVKRFVPLDLLLDRLKELNADTKKLLILDVASARGAAALGQLQPNFVQALKDHEDRLKEVKNLVVLVSADNDEHSWVAPEWGTSIFAHHVLEALKGEGTPERTITVQSLYDAVKKQVANWTRHNRARLQTPKLIDPSGIAGEFKLATRSEDTYEPPPLPEASPAGLKECREMWEECQRLEKERLPWLSSPARWRKYQDYLLRAEELYRAGDEENARKARKLADELKVALDPEKPPPSQALGLTLTMPDVLAAPLKKPAGDWLRAFAALVKEEQYDRCLTHLDGLNRAGETTREREVLRNRAAREFLRHLAADPRSLKKAWADPTAKKLLDALKDPVAPNAAETHFLVMLRPGAERGGPLKPLLESSDQNKAWALVALALQVRLLAEEAAAGLRPGEGPALSAELLAWTGKTVEEADRQRRLGHDLLFTSGEAKEWVQAEQALVAARSGYEKALAEAAQVRRAILARDRAMAQLPYYTHWLARRESARADADRLKEASWQSVRELGRRLAAGPDAQKPDPLTRPTEDVEKALATVKQEYEDVVGREQAANIQQDKWHEIDALLRVPVADQLKVGPAQRVQLLNKIHEISLELHRAFRNAREEARGVDRDAGEFHRLASFALAPLSDRPEVPSEWQTKLDGVVKLGQWVANQQVKLAQEAQARMKEAEEPKDLAEAIDALRKSAALARRVEGWSFENPGLLPAEPTERYRRLLLHRYLCWQATRAYLDHWAAAEPGRPEEDYYQVAGAGFLRHAEELLNDGGERDPKKPDPRRNELVAALRRFQSPPPFRVETSATGKDRGYVTATQAVRLADEESLPRWHRLRGPSPTDVPGRPVAWVEYTDRILRAEKGRPRRVQLIDQPFTDKILPVGELGSRSGRVGEYTVKAYFRGHQSAVTTQVTVYGEPDLVVVRPPQEKVAHLSLQARREMFQLTEKAAVAIVLDCSGSMIRDRLLDSDARRWDVAREALRTVLQEMPQGVTVSLRAFSADQSPLVREDVNLDPKDVEKARKEGWVNIGLVWESHAWNPAKLNARMKQIDALTPNGATPLLRSMWMARHDLPRRVKGGRRIMVVVTDGGDSNFYPEKGFDLDAPLKKKTNSKTIEQFLKAAFKDDPKFNDVELHVIGFDVRPHPNDGEAIRRALKELPQALREIKAGYYDARNSHDLATRLRGTLLRTSFIVDADFSRPGHDRPHEAGIVTDSRAGPGSLDWVELPARDYDRYTVRIPAFRALEGNVRLLPGDRLALQLVPGKRGPQLQRLLYAQSDALDVHLFKKRDKVTHDGETWHIAALQNELPRAGEKRLSLLTTLEQAQGPGEKGRVIQTVRPQWTWFEVYHGKAPAPELRIFPVGRYPAPAWGMTVPNWPSRDHPVTLKAWWTGKNIDRFARRYDVDPGESVLSLKERPWDRQGGEGITIESVLPETCKLRLPENGEETALKEVEECLVVRLRYPPGENGPGPLFVQLQPFGEWQGGQAHRWFHQAGKYTGIFWPVTAEKAQSLKSLFLYSIPELKQKLCASVELDLGNPDSTYVRPGPP